jgi:hypothetical protein
VGKVGVKWLPGSNHLLKRDLVWTRDAWRYQTSHSLFELDHDASGVLALSRVVPALENVLLEDRRTQLTRVLDRAWTLISIIPAANHTARM